MCERLDGFELSRSDAVPEKARSGVSCRSVEYVSTYPPRLGFSLTELTRQDPCNHCSYHCSYLHHSSFSSHVEAIGAVVGAIVGAGGVVVQLGTYFLITLPASLVGASANCGTKHRKHTFRHFIKSHETTVEDIISTQHSLLFY